MADLSRKRERDSLTARREPYWQRLVKGCYLGFRRGPDTWVARFKGKDGKQSYKALGEALDYDEAKKAAEGWLSQLSGSAVRVVTRGTVKEALERYLADLKQQGREGAAAEALGRFKTCVWDDEFASLELESLTQDDTLEWRDRLRKGRQNRSVNRQYRAVKAGLNRAKQLGHVGPSDAWKLKPLADDVEEGGETAVLLSAEHRKALVAAASPSLALFLRGLELTGARPKELAAATVSHFDGSTLRLAHKKGKPPRLKPRFVVLSEEGVAFFTAQAADKLPVAPLFTEDGTQIWRRHMWGRQLRAAIKEHNKTARGPARISPDATAYSFRHARISELLQVHNVDPLTVAQQTGTSVAMIELAYLKFIPSAMRDKLAAVKEA